ncbi:hypothetical protein UA74_13755 [Actinoalloteichus fjordicus]|uniref:Uncharacterized protein n=1 Tax=Actinoalloteichus fjordicus TaxID=1612552 RepID=A0AAC9PRV5_9PSEU|nr:hypothetical protein UA74_13755 [Actinoalloteichus fjordicus]
MPPCLYRGIAVRDVVRLSDVDRHARQTVRSDTACRPTLALPKRPATRPVDQQPFIPRCWRT